MLRTLLGHLVIGMILVSQLPMGDSASAGQTDPTKVALEATIAALQTQVSALETDEQLTGTPATRLTPTSESISEPTASSPASSPATEGARFEPDQLTMRLGEKATIGVVLPSTSFVGQYSLIVVLPQKLRLTSEPTCRSGCDGYAYQIIDRKNGETQIRVTGNYDGGKEPLTLALHIQTIASGPIVDRDHISARFTLSDGIAWFDPVDSKLEIKLD